MLRDIEKGISLAITIIGCVVSGWGLGCVIDSCLYTTPLFMVIGLLAGTGLAFWYLYNWSKK